MSIRRNFGFLLIIFVIKIFGHPLSDIYEICERYTQCRTIATLDERLCLGNTRSMPFWLPTNSLKSDEMSEHCHKTLKPYYKQLERLEGEESEQLLACLMEQAVPMNSDQRLQCHRDLLRAPKYNFNGDLMDRIPTNCFQGIQRRLEKQCGILRDCCSSVENCANFGISEITSKIKKLKDFIKDYGKQCQLGLATEDLLLNEDETQKIESKKPNGNIIVRFNTEEKPKQYSPKIETSQSRLLVRVFTAAEEIERLRESGDDVEADKLQKELNDLDERLMEKTSGTSSATSGGSEIEGTASLPLTSTTASTTSGGTETEDEFWSTQAPKMITGLEIATETSAPTSTTTESSSTSTTTIEESTTIPSTTTSTSAPTTTASSTTTTATTTVTETTPTIPSSTTTTTSSPTTTTRVHLITDTPQPEPSEAESEALLPNRSPSKNHSKVNDLPKTVTTNPPYPIDDILKKYSHVTTLNKLVEHFKDQNSETFTKNEPHQTTPTFIDSEKLHKFYDRWENSIREKLSTNFSGENDSEAAEEHARLLKTLNTLRNVIYNN
uniref:Uncharacterized protein n=1 Tax=Panagrolaimus sp. ES5 TaxID=591445 RepID=A0AC34FPC6_9BILA